jgi:hypothetical protein
MNFISTFVLDNFKKYKGQNQYGHFLCQRFIFLYCKNNLNGKRWPEAEKYIIKESKWIFLYAKHIIKKRWPEAEPVIMKDPRWACDYAIYVIKGRWLEAEPYLGRNNM